MRYGGLGFVLFVLASTSNAQAVDEAFERLMSVRTLRCVMDRGTQASWDAGNLKLNRPTTAITDPLNFQRDYVLH